MIEKNKSEQLYEIVLFDPQFREPGEWAIFNTRDKRCLCMAINDECLPAMKELIALANANAPKP